MKILELTAENIKKIKVVNFKPDANMQVIEGKNAQGKTSVMDSIAWALGGSKLIPERPIREGETEAKIELDLGEYLVTRWWKANKKSYLKVENKDGAKISSPQEMLNKLIGNLSFDPMEFCRKRPGERVAILKDIAGVNLDDLEAEYKKVFDDRTQANRDVKRSQDLWELAKNITDPGEIPSTSEIVKKQDEAKESNRKIKEAVNTRESAKKTVIDIKNKKDELLKQIEYMDNNIDKLYKEISSLEMLSSQELVDLPDISEDLAKIDSIRTQKMIYDSSIQKKKDFKGNTDYANDLTKKLEAIKKEKADRMNSAKFPVPGLDFQNGDISFEGVEFSEISTAQKTKVSMAISMALNPKLRIIRILDGSLLDSDSMEEVKKIATEKDFQVFVERVSDAPSGNAIFIEEGEQVKQISNDLDF